MAAFPIGFTVLWVFEGHLIYDYVWVDHLSEVKTLLHLALMIGISALILILWASYNWIRFSGEDRRAKAPNSSVELLAAQFSVTSDMLNDLQEKQRIILHYDDHGNLQKYE